MKSLIQYFKEVNFLLGESSRKIIWLVFIFLSSSLLDLAGIALIGPYVSNIFNPSYFLGSNFYASLKSYGLLISPDKITIILSALMIIVFLFKAASVVLISFIILKFAYKHGVLLRQKLMKSYQGLPYIDYARRNSSEYVYHIEALANQFALNIVVALLKTLSEGAVALSILIFLAWRNGAILSILIALLGSLVFIYDKLSRNRIRTYGRLSNEYSTRMVQGIHEGIEGLKEIRILGKEDHFFRMVSENAKKQAEVGVKTGIFTAAPRPLLELVLVSFVVMLVIVFKLTENSPEDLIEILSVFALASVRLIPSANTLLFGITRLRFGRNTVSLLYKDLVEFKKNEPVILSGELAFEERHTDFKSLKLENIEFSYPGLQTPVLKGISLNINEGDSIGIIGSSGSGKTTLIDLLLGLLKPQKGSIFFNGQALENSLSSLRLQIAYLPQQIFLIDNTLRRNVALGLEDSEIDDEKLVEALNQALLIDLIEQLPQGVNTMVGERGIRLSGGQRQRVALARAFYHGRNILVMDESTSALDNETEREIVSEIQRLKGRKTIIVIAHRVTTLKHCDKIIRLEKGRIVEQGTYRSIIGE
jgi:ATP-binding cassette, subfamily B, bacterial PglK